ncbi:MAG TPA: right-handed parallel beta-helix repeat-containing protein, partial [Kofleriaceae bacterium]
DSAVFDGSMFSQNGWGASSASSAWSDGLTVWSSANIRIVHSKFIDNSDVDLILGNGPGAVIENNSIGNHANFAFAALMLDNFNGGFAGNFTGASVRNNDINCTSGLCGFGVMLGPHFWYGSAPIIGTSAVVAGNTITTAKQGIFTAGASGFTISGNTITAGGAYAGTNYAGCTAQPLVVRAGDSVAVSGNTYGPFGNLLGGCGPGDLPGLTVHLPGVDYPVALAYQQILGRDADQGGGQAFTGLLHSSGLAAVRSSLANSTEAHNAIDAAYLQVLGRHVDPTGLAGNINALAAGSITMRQLRVNLELSGEALQNPYRRY